MPLSALNAAPKSSHGFHVFPHILIWQMVCLVCAVNFLFHLVQDKPRLSGRVIAASCFQRGEVREAPDDTPIAKREKVSEQ